MNLGEFTIYGWQFIEYNSWLFTENFRVVAYSVREGSLALIHNTLQYLLSSQRIAKCNKHAYPNILRIYRYHRPSSSVSIKQHRLIGSRNYVVRRWIPQSFIHIKTFNVGIPTCSYDHGNSHCCSTDSQSLEATAKRILAEDRQTNRGRWDGYHCLALKIKM